MPHSQPTALQQTMCKFHLDPQYHIFYWGSTILGDSTLCWRQNNKTMFWTEKHASEFCVGSHFQYTSLEHSTMWVQPLVYVMLQARNFLVLHHVLTTPDGVMMRCLMHSCCNFKVRLVAYMADFIKHTASFYNCWRCRLLSNVSSIL